LASGEDGITLAIVLLSSAVHKNNGTKETRRCLTTNSDGEIFVHFGFSSDPAHKTYLYVKTKC